MSRLGFMGGTWLALLLATSWTLPARGDFLDSYKAGLEAVDQENWPEVATQMRLAIEEQPSSSPRLKKRLYLKRYIPHYFLGRSLFEQQDCRGALAAWKKATAQGVIERYDEMASLERDRQICSQRQDEEARAVESARLTLDRAEEAATAAEALPGAELRAAWNRGEPSLAARRVEARKALEGAREALAALTTPADPEEVEDLQQRAQTAISLYDQLNTAATGELERLRGERTEAQASLEPTRLRAQRTLSEISYLSPLPPRVGNRAAKLEALLAATNNVGPTTSAEDVRTLKEKISTSRKALESAAAPPPRELRSAADALFQGNYSQVLELLEEVTLPGPKARSHSFLFQAAARFALYIGGGESDEALIDAARLDVLECLDSDPSRIPDAKAFSPRFVDFFLAQQPVTPEEASEGGEI
ncbi:MAG: hypothetical protein K0U98_13350 [Deltaproteobacteria bacterium]|nr:hypothetical protein [Deltaproteobacteria bacterium]